MSQSHRHRCTRILCDDFVDSDFNGSPLEIIDKRLDLDLKLIFGLNTTFRKIC